MFNYQSQGALNQTAKNFRQPDTDSQMRIKYNF